MQAKTKRREVGKMADTKAHAEWMKENTTKICARLNRNTDADILQYLEGRAPATEIKRGLRLLIELENKKAQSE